MSQPEIYRCTLTYALAIAGSKRALASVLNVTMPQLDNWLGGIATVPEQVFLNAIDVVVAASPNEIARSRCLLPKLTTPS